MFFWWKSEIFLSAKPEVELILTIAPMERSLMSNISKMVRDTMLDSKEFRYETNNGLSIGTTIFDLG